jgi:hypothetical protein
VGPESFRKAIAASERVASVSVRAGYAEGAGADAAAEVQVVGLIVGDVAGFEQQRVLVEDIVGEERNVIAIPTQARAQLQVAGDGEAGERYVVQGIVGVLLGEQGGLACGVLEVGAQVGVAAFPGSEGLFGCRHE